MSIVFKILNVILIIACVVISLQDGNVTAALGWFTALVYVVADLIDKIYED